MRDWLLIAWAKRKASASGPVFHPLRNHSLDALAVMGALWEGSFDAGERERLGAQFGVGASEAGLLAQFFAGTHDAGKLTPGFQAMDEGRYAELEKAGLPKNEQAARNKEPHGALSAKILNRFLQGQGWRAGFADQAASVVGGHHGSFIGSEIVEGESNLGGEAWRFAQRRLLECVMKAFGVVILPEPARVSSAGLVGAARLRTEFARAEIVHRGIVDGGWQSLRSRRLRSPAETCRHRSELARQ